MNKVILTGRLTKNPEIQYSRGSKPIAITKYTLAVNRRYKKDTEQEADFISCTAFGKVAEFAANYFEKGMNIGVSGRIQIGSWKDEKGQTHYKTDVIVDEQEFLERKKTAENKEIGNDINYTTGSIEEYEELPF